MKELIELARQSIKCFLENRKLVVDELIKQKYNSKKACFVTLRINKHLRGCIGNLYPKRELWKDVVINAVNAAFFDPRFQPLSKQELEKIKIEISVLSKLKPLKYKDANELKQKIFGKGVVIKKGTHVATYLPQVWQELPDPEIFLSSLCQKAGLSKHAWKNENLEVFVYTISKISED